MKLERLAYAPGPAADFFEKPSDRSARCVNAPGTTACKSSPKAAPPDSGTRTASWPKKNFSSRRRRNRAATGRPRSVSRLPAHVSAGRVPGRHWSRPAPRRRAARRQTPRSRAGRGPSGSGDCNSPPPAAGAPKPTSPPTGIVPWSPWCAAKFKPSNNTGRSTGWPSHSPTVNPMPTSRKTSTCSRSQPPGQTRANGLHSRQRRALHLQRALEQDLEAELAAIRQRQEQYLRRELERVDNYFENYLKELGGRLARSRSAETKTKLADRRRAAHAEHERRRQDQVRRHEIRIIPHVDALLLLADPPGPPPCSSPNKANRIGKRRGGCPASAVVAGDIGCVTVRNLSAAENLFSRS